MVKIFVGRLAESVTRDQLQKLFEKFGEVSDCDILRDYGFVHMADESHALKAIRELDRLELGGSRISVELSTSRSMKSCQLIVGNLPDGTSSHDVHRLFKKFGTVTLCRISGGQAMVHMRWASMAVQAIRNLNGETYKGCVLSVQFANSTNTSMVKNIKDDWYGTAPNQPNQPRSTSSVGPRYIQNDGIQPLTSTETSYTSVWNNFTNDPHSNHILSNGTGPDTNFHSGSPGSNQNNNLPNNGLMSVDPLSSIQNAIPIMKDTNMMGDQKSQGNTCEIIGNLSGDSPSHSTISSSSYEEINKQPELTKSRNDRRQYIAHGLQFLQSPMPWTGSPDDYTSFLNKMKQMLLQEGSELRREGRYSDAVQKLSEALNMCKYMESEGIKGHSTNLVTLITERSAALIELGQYNPALEEANKALQLSNGSSQEAMRCKAKALMKIGKAKDAYDLMIHFSQCNNMLDSESSELINNLTQMLGLLTRKPYRPATQSFSPFLNNHSSGDIIPGPGSDPQNYVGIPAKPDSGSANISSVSHQSLESFSSTNQALIIATESQTYRPFLSGKESFSDPSFKPRLKEVTSLNSSNQSISGNPNRMMQTTQPNQIGLMQGFNKTPGTALHGYPSTVGGMMGERPGSTSNVMNGAVVPGGPSKMVAPIGPQRPVGSRMSANPYSGFSNHEPQSGSLIGDSLRKNMEIISENQQISMFGQPSHSGSSLQSVMENSLDLVSGIKNLAVNTKLPDNSGEVHNSKVSTGTNGPGSKMWNYMSGNHALNNNNNGQINNGNHAFNSGMPAPIGYREPFSSLNMGGDASLLLSPGIQHGIRPDFPGSSNNSGSLPFLTSSGDSAFNMSAGHSKTKDMNGTDGSDVKASGHTDFSLVGNFQNSSTLTSSSNQFGALRLSSDPISFPQSAPSYTHFPQVSGQQLGLGQLFGPSALGLGISSSLPTTSPSQIPAQPTQPSIASIVGNQKAQSEQSEDSLDIMNAETDESLDSYLRNPLHNTHEFLLGCSDCVIKTGPKVIDYRYDSILNHMCYKNILLCRRRDATEWHKIRPRPQPQSKAQLYDGPYYICKDLLAGQDCTYPVVCTFAYNQEEIDVWTLERKQMLNRRWLFDSLDEEYMRDLTVVGRVLCKHRGLFNFLCHACFTNKPRIISTFSIGTGKCIHANSEHAEVPENRQLTHILRDTAVRYTAIRAPAQQPILCRHEVRFQCTREMECHFAHSLVERDVWALMIKKGLTSEQIVEQSHDYISKLNTNANALEQGITQSTDLGVPMFRWKVKFICSLCYKNGQISEATKDRKYCLARAQHSWATNKKTVLVQTIRKDWTQIRDLPYLKNKGLPARFELCENIRRQKKCPFSIKCNFAHSQEELDIWIYLRDNQLKDLEDLHDSLNKDKQLKTNKGSLPGSDPNAIRLPTDFLPQSAFHCWLCNKECNGQRQWEQHCSSVKHRLGALSDADGNWKYRNPGGEYEICERHLKNMCEYDYVLPGDNKCRYAHSTEELEEWRQRREYVINRIKKAQNDNLISSSDDMDKLIKESQQQMQ